MRLFGKRAREEARPALSRAGSIAEAGQWPRSYEAQVREGYAANPVAQRAVKLVAEAVAGAPLAGDAAMIALVGAGSGGVAVLEAAAAQLLLHGNAFIQVLRDGEGGAAALYPLRPERVAVEVDAAGWPAAYRYRVGDRASRLAADGPRPDVVHVRSFNPLDDHYGMGCLAAASPGIAIHNAAARWNKALLDNAARPSGALVYEPGDGGALAPDQFDRLKAEMDAGFAGAANAGRPMLLEGGLRWQALSLSPTDMDFVALKAAAARDIALAFGVPPMLLGLPGDSTHANYREANRAVWRMTVLPLAGALLGGIARGLAGWFPDGELRVDLDRVPALAEDRQKLWASVKGADFLSADEKRALLGLDPQAGELP
ncbi:phage portal protein [Sphingomonas sp. XXL09]|uniref:phage portal protein n=1 Tax=Sphingomonas sp. XXL09 TaxID=3457787 RepID=UPI00406BB312